MPSTCPGVTGRVPVIFVPGPPGPPLAPPPEPPFPPLAPIAVTCRLVTPKGTVKLLNAAGKKVTVTGGAAADAGALAANGKTAPSSNRRLRSPSARPALGPGESELRA